MKTQSPAHHSIALSDIVSDGTFDHHGVAIEAIVALEGAYSLRALLAVGKSTDHDSRLVTDPTTNRTLPVYTSGAFETLRVGFEGRSGGTLIRVFGGIDVGYEADHHTFAHMTEYVGAFVTAPRIGLEIGHRIRARAAIEARLLEHFDGDGPSAATGASLGVGFGF